MNNNMIKKQGQIQVTWLQSYAFYTLDLLDLHFLM